MPILPSERDPRLVTIRRGGTLTDEHHRMLAAWALDCAEHVLPLYERHRAGDPRARDAIEIGRAWVRGEASMSAARLAFSGSRVGHGLPDSARFAALAVGQAVAVAHVAAHELGAAAYAIRAAGASVSIDDAARAQAEERDWQRAALRSEVREIVLDDQRRRSALCWHVFDD